MSSSKNLLSALITLKTVPNSKPKDTHRDSDISYGIDCDIIYDIYCNISCVIDYDISYGIDCDISYAIDCDICYDIDLLMQDNLKKIQIMQPKFLY